MYHYFNVIRLVVLIFSFIGNIPITQAGTIEPQSKRPFTPLPYQHETAQAQPIPKNTPPKKLVTSGTESVEIELSGHINRVMTYGDNGPKKGLIHADNDNAPSRLRTHARAKVTDRFSMGADVEFDISSNNSYVTDIGIDNGAVNLRQRKTEALFISKDLGTLSLGHGYMVSFTGSENDLSKTDAATSGCIMEEITGGITFRQKDIKGLLGIGPSVGSAFDSMDGFRSDRIRWDSPSIYGFTASAAHAVRYSYDMGLSYNGKIYGTEIQGSTVHISRYKRYKQTSGSVSILFPCGLNIGGGSGFKKLYYPQHQPGIHHHRHHPYFYAGKIGYIMKPFSIGDTAFAIDRGISRHSSANRDLVFLTGATIAQHINIACTEVYLGARHHRLKSFNTHYHDIFAGFLGVRVRF